MLLPIRENDFGYLNTSNYFEPHITSDHLLIHLYLKDANRKYVEKKVIEDKID